MGFGKTISALGVMFYLHGCLSGKVEICNTQNRVREIFGTLTVHSNAAALVRVMLKSCGGDYSLRMGRISAVQASSV